jgi:hypothetical protein
MDPSAENPSAEIMIEAGNGQRRAAEPAVRSSMRYRIAKEAGHITAHLYNRHTARETAEFLRATADECYKHGCYDVLISVHRSRPIFTVERYGFSAFVELALKYPSRIAVTADSSEVRLSHEYAAMLARLRGVNVRAFRDDAAAAAWLERPLK